MKMRKSLLAGFLSMVLIGSAACNKLDVIGDKSIKSFESVVEKMEDKVKEDTAFGGWSLEAPDGSVRFLWSRDFSKTTKYDAYMEFDAKPFVDAGLDTGKLPDGMLIGDKIIIGTNLGDDTVNHGGEVTPVSSYKKIVESYRNNVTYHMALDHYGIDLMNGNMIEWAKDMSTNDKDLVFVLNPQIFIDAGVDPNGVEGWVFAKVPTMDERGKDIEVDKLLKPFDLDRKIKK